MITGQISPRTRFPILEVSGLGLILVAMVLLVLQLGQFSFARRQMPPGLVVGGVPVGGLTREESRAYIEKIYGSPITVMYLDQEIRLNPNQIGFVVNTDTLLARADEIRTEGAFWSGFWDYVWIRSENETMVELSAQYSSEALRGWLADIAARYDRPPQPAQPVLATMSFQAGQPGYVLNLDESVKAIDQALRRPTNRTVSLVVDQKVNQSADLATLKGLMVDYLVSKQFDGVASVYVIDLHSGDEMDLEVDLRGGNPSYLNCDVAYASTSTMKIPIMIEFFRHLDWLPTEGSDEYKILMNTMTKSSNPDANFMMQDIGFGNPFVGARTVSDSMKYLGLKNTFIAAPYDDTSPPEYFSTPAREAARNGTCVNTRPDEYMQTTVDDLAMALDMIYQCAEYGGGGLLAAYPGDITQEECKMMISVMEQNEAGILMAGLPKEIAVAHKHGWVTDTHGDTGIVFTPGGDYVFAAFLWADVDWLQSQVSFPIIRDLSSATFNYFNPDKIAEPRRGFASELGIGN